MSDINDVQSARKEMAKAGVGVTSFKNVKAYWEQSVRKGLFMPAYSSKFVNEKTITQMNNNEILAIR